MPASDGSSTGTKRRWNTTAPTSYLIRGQLVTRLSLSRCRPKLEAVLSPIAQCFRQPDTKDCSTAGPDAAALSTDEIGVTNGAPGHSSDLDMTRKLFALLTSTLIATAAHGGEFPDISIGDLKAAIEAKKVTVIDVNGTESFQNGHIPGAIDFARVKDQLEKVLPKDKEALIVAYCGGPSCQAYQAAAKAAKKLGYKNVKHLSAGISGWKSSGQKVETGN
jgi:rhodanese-related sulfurtransferase